MPWEMVKNKLNKKIQNRCIALDQEVTDGKVDQSWWKNKIIDPSNEKLVHW